MKDNLLNCQSGPETNMVSPKVCFTLRKKTAAHTKKAREVVWQADHLQCSPPWSEKHTWGGQACYASSTLTEAGYKSTNSDQRNGKGGSRNTIIYRKSPQTGWGEAAITVKLNFPNCTAPVLLSMLEQHAGLRGGSKIVSGRLVERCVRHGAWNDAQQRIPTMDYSGIKKL